jgi:hypothetical protein
VGAAFDIDAPEPLAFPSAWLGWWLADDGKAILLEAGDGEVLLTACAQRDGPPSRSAQLLEGGTRPIARVPAAYRTDADGRLHLEVEAGTPGVGPTLRLYAVAAETADGTPTTRQLADPRAAAGDVVLLPQTGIGLYDDFEDDLGVPWAYPLLPFRWAGAA